MPLHFLNLFTWLNLKGNATTKTIIHNLTFRFSNFSVLFSWPLFKLAISPMKDTSTCLVHSDSLFVCEPKNVCSIFSLLPEFIVIDSICEVKAVLQELVVTVTTGVNEEGFCKRKTYKSWHLFGYRFDTLQADVKLYIWWLPFLMQLCKIKTVCYKPCYT